MNEVIAKLFSRACHEPLFWTRDITISMPLHPPQEDKNGGLFATPKALASLPASGGDAPRCPVGIGITRLADPEFCNWL